MEFICTRMSHLSGALALTRSANQRLTEEWRSVSARGRQQPCKGNMSIYASHISCAGKCPLELLSYSLLTKVKSAVNPAKQVISLNPLIHRQSFAVTGEENEGKYSAWSIFDSHI